MQHEPNETGFVISAWVVTLAPGGLSRLDVIETLRRWPDARIGELAPTGRLPMTVETPDVRRARDLLEMLGALPGVLHVDVVGIYHEQADQAA